MGIFSKLLSAGAGDLVEKVGSTIDGVHTSQEEKLKLLGGIKSDLYDFIGNMQKATEKMETEVTHRLQADNQGSVLTRNVRPISFIVTFSITIFLVVYRPGQLMALEYMQDLLGIMTGFYFGGRSIEKSIKLIKGASVLSNSSDDVLEKSSGFMSRLLRKKKNDG